MIKLTPKQWELIERLDEGAWLVRKRMPSGLRFYTVNANCEISRTNIATVSAVMSEGLLYKFPGSYGLSHAGRAALAARKAALAKGGA